MPQPVRLPHQPYSNSYNCMETINKYLILTERERGKLLSTIQHKNFLFLLIYEKQKWLYSLYLNFPVTVNEIACTKRQESFRFGRGKRRQWKNYFHENESNIYFKGKLQFWQQKVLSTLLMYKSENSPWCRKSAPTWFVLCFHQLFDFPSCM